MPMFSGRGLRMKPRTLRWARATVIVTAGLVFLVLAVVVVSAISSPEAGSTRPGAHNFRDIETVGDALCEGCHFPPHNQHAGLNTCSDCHPPEKGGHAARPVTCQTCHTNKGAQATPLPAEPLPDVPPTTAAPPATTTTIAPTLTTIPPPAPTTTLPPATTTVPPTTLAP